MEAISRLMKHRKLRSPDRAAITARLSTISRLEMVKLWEKALVAIREPMMGKPMELFSMEPSDLRQTLLIARQ